MGNMFDLDDSLLKEDKKETKDYSEMLKKANIFCMRELFDKALAIYNEILDEDMENEEAYIGLLKVHSAYFTKYEGEQIEKDIRVIERMFPETVNEEYATYCLARKKALANKAPEVKVEPKVEVKEEKKVEAKPVEKVEVKKTSSAYKIDKDVKKAMHFLDTYSYKRAIDLATSLLSTRPNDYYLLFVLGFGNYMKDRYNDAKKYLESFLSHIDENNPFYYKTVRALAYSYSAKSGRVPVLDKALYYYKKDYEILPNPKTKAYIELINESKNHPEMGAYIYGKGPYSMHGYRECVDYGNKLIKEGDVRGYFFVGHYDWDLSAETRVNTIYKYLKDPHINKESELYCYAWLCLAATKTQYSKEKVALPQNVVAYKDYRFPETKCEDLYSSLK